MAQPPTLSSSSQSGGCLYVWALINTVTVGGFSALYGLAALASAALLLFGPQLELLAIAVVMAGVISFVVALLGVPVFKGLLALQHSLKQPSSEGMPWWGYIVLVLGSLLGLVQVGLLLAAAFFTMPLVSNALSSG